MKIWTYLGTGRNRAVYLLPGNRNVIKIPLNDEGVFQNEYEARSAKRDDWLYRWQKARCRLIFPCLIMEYVELGPFSDLPDWSDYVDCQQVGKNRLGNFVAYDWA